MKKILFLPIFAGSINAAEIVAGEKSDLNLTAITLFLIFVFATLIITYFSARKASGSNFYTAGGGISGFNNGMAMAGDFMSAASFLGISTLVFTNGFDGL